jgi:hypothetical protein
MFGSIVSACCRYKHFVAKAIDILGLGPWGYWRSDAGVNGKLAVDLANTIGAAQVDYNSGTTHSIDGSTVSAYIVCDSDDWSNATKQILYTINDGTTTNEIELSTAGGTMSVKATLGGTTTTATYTHTYTGFNHILVSVTENSTTGITIYSNGSEVTYGGSRDTTGDTFSATLTTVYEGGSNLSTSNPLDGALDQFVIANNYDLSADASTFYGDAGKGIKEGDLVGSESFYNSVQASNGGSWYDHDTPARPGRESSQEKHALNIDGNKFAEVDDSTEFSFGNGTTDSPFSIGGWIYMDDATDFVMFSKDGSSSNREYAARFVSDEIQLYLIDGSLGTGNYIGRKVTGVTSNESKWVHIVFTYNGSGLSSGIKIYINGVQCDDDNVQGGMYTAMDNKSENFRIGRQGPIYSDGKIDEMFVYDGVLDEDTHGEIATLYNGGEVKSADELLEVGDSATLISSWSFNGQTVKTVGNDSYGSNHLTPNNIVNADLVPGVKDARTQYAELNGSSDYLRYSSPAPFIVGNNPMTWVFDLEVGGYSEDIINVYTTPYSGANIAYYVAVNVTGKIGMFIWDDSGNILKTETDKGYSVGERVQIAFTYDGGTDTTNINCYVRDGATGDWSNPAQTKSDTGYTAMTNNGTEVLDFGFHPTVYSSHKFYMASFLTEELSLTSLNTNWKLTDYDSYTGSTTNLVSWYDFENSADLGKDSHSTNDLTVNGSPTVGAARDTGLDLTPSGTLTFVGGQVVGQVINEENVFSKSDTSGNSNDFEQATVGDQPIGIEDGFGTGESLQHWHDGTKNYLKTNTSPYWSGDWAVAVVVKVLTTPTGTEYVMSQWGATDKMWGIRVTSGGEIRVAISNDGTAATFTTGFSFTEDTWYVYVATHEDGVEIAHYVYDTTGTLLDSDVVAHTTGMHDGSGVNELILGGSDNNKFDGETADAVAFQKVLTEAERTTVVNEILTNVGLIS